jgi:hypothetical protein
VRHPEYYLGRADEARVIAQGTLDLKAREVLIKSAEEYEGLAKIATVRKSEELAEKIKLSRTNYISKRRSFSKAEA